MDTCSMLGLELHSVKPSNLLFSRALEGNYYDLYFRDEKIQVQEGCDLSQSQ